MNANLTSIARVNSHNVLYVEDDLDDARLICDEFERETDSPYNITHLASFREALERIRNGEFNAVLLDLNLPDGKGLDGIEMIRDIKPDLPVVIITSRDDEKAAADALAKGAQEYVVKQHINNNIVKRILQSSILRKQVEAALKQKAYSDILTGLPNRSAFEQIAGRMIARAKRHQMQEALMFIDLDGFKKINDTYGHEAGNKILKEVAARLNDTLRRSDVVARYGGDEFICYLDSSDKGPLDKKLCRKIAQKIIKVIEKPIAYNGYQLYVSASIGIALFPDAGSDFASLLENADQAMYMAKRNKNKSFCFVDEVLGADDANKKPAPSINNIYKDWQTILRPMSGRINDNNASHISTVPQSLAKPTEALPAQLQTALERQQQEHEQLLSEFCQMAAHDLRAPVRKIATFSELMVTQYDDLTDEEKKMFLQRMLKGGNELGALIDALLQYVESGQPKQKLRQQPIRPFLESFFEEQRCQLKDIEVQIHVDRNVNIPVDILRSILVQLLDNSLTYQDKSQALEINIAATCPKDNMILIFKDNGIGIDPEYRQQIFMPFKRLHSRDEIPGSGLGLTICKRLLQKHGGQIELLASDNGKGAAFQVTLPLVK
jgi:diguanylate cyclase (GGDEF)-like protein